MATSVKTAAGLILCIGLSACAGPLSQFSEVTLAGENVREKPIPFEEVATRVWQELKNSCPDADAEHHAF